MKLLDDKKNLEYDPYLVKSQPNFSAQNGQMTDSISAIQHS